MTSGPKKQHYGGKKGQGTTKRAKQAEEEDPLASLELLQTTTSGFIETEGMEKTFQIQQDELVKHIAVQNIKKRFELKLESPNGGYSLDYTRNGRHMLIGGGSGHVAGFDWQAGRLRSEIQTGEAVRDVVWLQDETLYAAAQKSCVYIYDQSGTELHSLRKHTEPTHLEYLPYHFLLFSACGDNHVRYQDVSTGQQVAEWNTKAGIATATTQNPANAVTITGHSGGVVSMWSPTISNALVKMFVHRGPVKSVAVDNSGHYMVTAGMDGSMKTWDLRTFKMLDQYKVQGRSVSSLAISHTGLLAAGAGPNLTVWKDIFKSHQKTPYLRHTIPSCSINQMAFCPFEDVLGIGHTGGISSLIVPGAGEANFDALEANPFANKKQRQEKEVRQLLDKLQPETIMLDPDVIGSVSRPSVDAIFDMQSTAALANRRAPPSKEKNKMRGKSSATRKLARKRENIIDEKKMRAQEEAKRIQVIRSGGTAEPKAWSALDRFAPKPE